MIDTNLQFNDIYQALKELAIKKAIPRKPVGYLALKN